MSVSVTSSLPDPFVDIATKLKLSGFGAEWSTPLSVLKSIIAKRRYVLLQGIVFAPSSNTLTFGLLAAGTTPLSLQEVNDKKVTYEPSGELIAIILHHSSKEAKKGKLLSGDIESILSTLERIPSVALDTTQKTYGIPQEYHPIYISAIKSISDPQFIPTDILLVSNKEYVSGEGGMQKIAEKVQYLDTMWSFSLDELESDRTQHDLQPEITHVLTEAEKDEFLRTRKVQLNQLSYAYTTDPLFKILGVKAGKILYSVSDNRLPGTINSKRVSWRVARHGKRPPAPKS